MPDDELKSGKKGRVRGKHARLESGLLPRINLDSSENGSFDEGVDGLGMGDAGQDPFSAAETQMFTPVNSANPMAGANAGNVFAQGENPQYAAAQFGASGSNEVVMPKDRTNLKRGLAIGGGVIVAILVIAYLAGIFFFSSHLFPNTKLGDLDVSMKTASDVRESVNKQIKDYKLTVTGPNGFSVTANATDLGIVCGDNMTLDQLAPNRNVLAWPIEVFQSHNLIGSTQTSYNLVEAQSVIGGAVQTFNETATQPTNATLTFDKATNTFAVAKEQVGTALDETKVVDAAVAAITNLQETLVLDQTYLKQPSVLSTDTRINNAKATASTMIKADVTYTLAGTTVAHLTPEIISGWILLDDDCNATLDSEKVTAWAEATATPLNTVGTERTYTRPDGKVITVEGGVYGWEVDTDAFVEQVNADVSAGAVTTSAIPCTMEGEGFTAVGGADWGKRYIDVDLSEQYVRFYDSEGNLIWEADCISGAPTNNHATPQGVWYVVTKESPSKLIGYAEDGVTKEYETTVQYWMPFEGVGVGFHDATWQPSFGGTMYADGYGSHGCINLSYSSAESLYCIIEPNDVVVVHE